MDRAGVPRALDPFVAHDAVDPLVHVRAVLERMRGARSRKPEDARRTRRAPARVAARSRPRRGASRSPDLQGARQARERVHFVAVLRGGRRLHGSRHLPSIRSPRERQQPPRPGDPATVRIVGDRDLDLGREPEPAAEGLGADGPEPRPPRGRHVDPPEPRRRCSPCRARRGEAWSESRRSSPARPRRADRRRSRGHRAAVPPPSGPFRRSSRKGSRRARRRATSRGGASRATAPTRRPRTETRRRGWRLRPDRRRSRRGEVVARPSRRRPARERAPRRSRLRSPRSRRRRPRGAACTRPPS